MKVTYSVILLSAFLATTHCYPAENKENTPAVPDKDIDFVPLEEQSGHGFPPGGVVDIDANSDGFFGNPFFGNPFPSVFGSLEGLMARMRQQLSEILGRLPSKTENGQIPEINIHGLGDIDLGKGNTTSVTKIINGHKVTINETEYKQDNENGTGFFKVRIVDVHPEGKQGESTEKDAETLSYKPEPESVEDSISNEIPKVRDNEALNFGNIETFDEVDSLFPHKYINTRKTNEWDNIKVHSFEGNSIESVPGQVLHDLSNDIYVNQIMADTGAPTNPDAEVFNPTGGHTSSVSNPQKHVPIKHSIQTQEYYAPPMPVFNPFLAMYYPPMFPINHASPGMHPIKSVSHSSLPDLEPYHYLTEEQSFASNRVKKQIEETKATPVNIRITSEELSSPVTNQKVLTST